MLTLLYDRRVLLVFFIILMLVTKCNDPYDGQRRWTPS